MQAKATNEHHWYCPFCERSCLSPMVQVGERVWHITCSTCGEKYTVVSEGVPDNVEGANLHPPTPANQNYSIGYAGDVVGNLTAQTNNRACRPRKEKTMEQKKLEEICAEYREGCKGFEVGARRMVEGDYFKNEQSFYGQHSEMKAQLMLAVRHLEDARMRFGKVLQYAGNGVSIYDKA